MEQLDHEQRGEAVQTSYEKLIGQYSDADAFIYKLKDGTLVALRLPQVLQVCGGAIEKAANDSEEGAEGAEKMFSRMHTQASQVAQKLPKKFDELIEAGHRYMSRLEQE